MANRIALIVIGRFKPAWNELDADEQAAFAVSVGRTARRAGVTALVGYKLTTQGSFLEVWEADDRKKIEQFIGELDGLGYKKYYDEVLMLGERAEEWIANATAADGAADRTAPRARPGGRARR